MYCMLRDDEPKISWIAVSIEHRLVTDIQTDRHGAIAYATLA